MSEIVSDRFIVYYTLIRGQYDIIAAILNEHHYLSVKQSGKKTTGQCY